MSPQFCQTVKVPQILVKKDRSTNPLKPTLPTSLSLQPPSLGPQLQWQWPVLEEEQAEAAALPGGQERQARGQGLEQARHMGEGMGAWEARGDGGHNTVLYVMIVELNDIIAGCSGEGPEEGLPDPPWSKRWREGGGGGDAGP